MDSVQHASGHTVVLTGEGRRRLEVRLRQASEALRAVEAGLVDRTDPVATDEHRRLIAQVNELRSVLRRARPPRTVADDPRIVEVGDEVVVEFDDGAVDRYVLVEPFEAALVDGHVSAASPLGRALLRRAVGERVSVDAPSGSYGGIIRDRRRAD